MVAPVTSGAVCMMVLAMPSNCAATFGMVEALTAAGFPLWMSEASEVAAWTRAARSISVICACVLQDTAKIRPGASSVTKVIANAKRRREQACRDMKVRPFRGRTLAYRYGGSLRGSTTASLVQRGGNLISAWHLIRHAPATNGMLRGCAWHC